MSYEYSQAELDNLSNQLNPNHDEYWHCTGEYDDRPDDWETRER